MLVMQPKKQFPIKPPIHKIDATQEASAIDILPDGNGLSSEVNKGILGLDQPAVAPLAIKCKFTI